MHARHVGRLADTLSNLPAGIGAPILAAWNAEEDQPHHQDHRPQRLRLPRPRNQRLRTRWATPDATADTSTPPKFEARKARRVRTFGPARRRLRNEKVEGGRAPQPGAWKR